MKDKIEVGEYVRINNDFRLIALGIGKVIKINQDTIYTKMNFEMPFSFKIENIAKHSFNLIDLIEVGDYVNGKEVKHIAMFEGFPDYPKLIFVDETHLIPSETCKNEEIKSIVTKEQMASIEYRVEEE